MIRNVYMKIIEDIINEMELRQAVLCVWKLNRDLTVLQPHMKRTCTLVEQNLMNRYIPWDMCNASFPLTSLGRELDDEYVLPMEPYYEPKQPSFRLPEEKKEVELYDEEGLDEAGHKKENPLLKLLHADTDMEVQKNMELLSEICEEENEVTLYRLFREVSGVVDPCHFCKGKKSMYPDSCISGKIPWVCYIPTPTLPLS